MFPDDALGQVQGLFLGQVGHSFLWEVSRQERENVIGYYTIEKKTKKRNKKKKILFRRFFGYSALTVLLGFVFIGFFVMFYACISISKVLQ